jgi:hypothetical protein
LLQLLEGRGALGQQALGLPEALLESRQALLEVLGGSCSGGRHLDGLRDLGAGQGAQDQARQQERHWGGGARL